MSHLVKLIKSRATLQDNEKNRINKLFLHDNPELIGFPSSTTCSDFDYNLKILGVGCSNGNILIIGCHGISSKVELPGEPVINNIIFCDGKFKLIASSDKFVFMVEFSNFKKPLIIGTYNCNNILNEQAPLLIGYNKQEINERFLIYLSNGRDIYSLDLNTFNINNPSSSFSSDLFVLFNEEIIIYKILSLYKVYKEGFNLLIVQIKRHVILYDYLNGQILAYYHHYKEISNISLQPWNNSFDISKFYIIISDVDGKILVIQFDNENTRSNREDFIAMLQNKQSYMVKCIANLTPFSSDLPLKPIFKISWIMDKFVNKTVLFIMGGLPNEIDYMDKHTLTICELKGLDIDRMIIHNEISLHVLAILEAPTKINNALAVDFGENRVNETRIRIPSTILFTEEEIIMVGAKSLTNNLKDTVANAKMVPEPTPYLTCLHGSAITCVHVCDNAKFARKFIEYCHRLPLVPSNDPVLENWPITGLPFNPTTTCDLLRATLTEQSKKLKSTAYQEDPISHYEILVTGHEDGTIKFWCLPLSQPYSAKHLVTLKTTHLIPGFEPDEDIRHANDSQTDENLLKIQSVGVFDPFSDDPRCAIHKINIISDEGCYSSRSFHEEVSNDTVTVSTTQEKFILGVGGAAGQCIFVKDLFGLLDYTTKSSPHGLGKRDATELYATLRKESSLWCSVDLVKDRNKFVWKGPSPLYQSTHTIVPKQEIKGVDTTRNKRTLILGCQIKPPAAVTLINFSKFSRLVCLATAHGFALIDLEEKEGEVPYNSQPAIDDHVTSCHPLLFFKCTLDETNDSMSGDTALSIKKSLKKSLRQSFRRLRRLRNPAQYNGAGGDDADFTALKQAIKAHIVKNINSSFRRKQQHSQTMQNKNAQVATMLRQNSKWIDLSTERCIEARPATVPRLLNPNVVGSEKSSQTTKSNLPHSEHNVVVPKSSSIKCAHFYDAPPIKYELLVLKPDDSSRINTSTVPPSRTTGTGGPFLGNKIISTPKTSPSLRSRFFTRDNCGEHHSSFSPSGVKGENSKMDGRDGSIADGSNGESESYYSVSTTLWLGNASGNVAVYQIESKMRTTTLPTKIVPDGKEEQLSGPVKQRPNKYLSRLFTGRQSRLVKEINLKHGAPVIGVTTFGSEYRHFSTTNSTAEGSGGWGAASSLSRRQYNESDFRSSSAPQPMTCDNKLLIVTEEQLKLFSWPQLKPICKYRLTALEGSLMRKMFWSHFTFPPDETKPNQQDDRSYGEQRFIVTLSNHGEVSVFNPLTLKRLYQTTCFRKEDINGISSFLMMNHGQGFYMQSSKEVARISFSVAYTKYVNYLTSRFIASTIHGDISPPMPLLQNQSTLPPFNSVISKDNNNNNNRSDNFENVMSTTTLVDPFLTEELEEDDSFYKETTSLCQKLSLDEMKKALM